MKNRIKCKHIAIFAIFITVFLLFSLSNVSAANNTISDTSSGGILQGIDNTGTGDTLFLQPGIYKKSNDRGIVINKSITIQGNGSKNVVLIDAQKLSNIFEIQSNDISFINISFINGNSSNGGAIYNGNFSNITFIRCNFITNTVTGYGGAIINYGDNLSLIDCAFINNEAYDGAVVYESGSNLRIVNCSFANNIAQHFGGVIYNKGGNNLNIINSNFFNNTATWGGVIFGWLKTDIKIILSNFTNNKARTGSGGVIYNEGDNYLIMDCIFNNNEATIGYGGAIINHGANFILINTAFINNTAGASGGAIYNHRVSQIGQATHNFTVMNCTFTNNKAGWGAAIYNYGLSSIIMDSNFTGNKAENYGGALNNNGNLNLSNCNFIANNAGTGGAVYNNRNSNLSLSSNIMSGNSANLGQMIYNAGNMGILNISFMNNSTHFVKNGAIVSLFAYLTDDMGNTVTGQDIYFYVDGSFFGTEESVEGYASISYLAHGPYGVMIPISGSYEGTGSYWISVKNGQLFIQLESNSTINAPNGKIGNPMNIFGIAKDENGNPIANSQIKITIDGKTYNVVTNSNGGWNLIFTPVTSGNFTATVSWGGNSSHIGFINTTSFNVRKIATNINVIAPNTKINQTIDISGILVDEDANIIANAQLNVTVDGKTYTVSTDINGRWILSYTATNIGSINVLVSFEGNNIYLASSNTTIFNVEDENGVNSTNNTTEINTDDNTNGTGNTKDLSETNKTKKGKNHPDGDVAMKKTSENLAVGAAMKKTGIPIIAILLVLLTSLGLSIRRKL